MFRLTTLISFCLGAIITRSMRRQDYFILTFRGDGMSSMIRCDKCKKMMYADSRSDKGDWCTVRIDYVDGLSTLHLCKVCHRQFLVEFTRVLKPEEYDDEFGSWWDDEVTT